MWGLPTTPPHTFELGAAPFTTHILTLGPLIFSWWSLPPLRSSFTSCLPSWFYSSYNLSYILPFPWIPLGLRVEHYVFPQKHSLGLPWNTGLLGHTAAWGQITWFINSFVGNTWSGCYQPLKVLHLWVKRSWLYCHQPPSLGVCEGSPKGWESINPHL